MKQILYLNKTLLHCRKSVCILLTLLFLSTATVAQTVSGIVTDDSGEGLVGASVVVKETNSGTITDVDGKFTLEDVKEGSILVISYTGYTPQEVAASARYEYCIGRGSYT